MKPIMNRPDGLPDIDLRAIESKDTCKYLCDGIEGLVDTPTQEQLKSVEDGIMRQLKLRRKLKDA
jgi:hypothetical protein